MSFQSLSAELTGSLPGLSPFLADTFINRGWRSVRDARLWSFLQQDGAIICPTQVVAGTVAVVQFTATVTADATASAALLALSATPGLTSLQIRFGGAGDPSSTGQLYSITSVNQGDPTAIILTLNRVVVEVDNATSGYQVYRAYIRAPADDFLAWQSFVDMTNAWPLGLNYTSTEFDRRDPQRQAQGCAYYVGAYKGNDALENRPQYELWPHPTAGQTFYVRYRRQGLDFSAPTEVQPPIIPDSLIIERAQGWHAYPWAAKNVSHMPKLRGVAWVSLTVESKRSYAGLLLDAKRQDDNQELDTVWDRGHGLRSGYSMGGWRFPIDANFLQSHLVNF